MCKYMESEVLLDAAAEVLAENTLGGVRVRLVAERAGMVQSNLHYYYKSKQDLLVALYRRVLDRFAQHRKKVAGMRFQDLRSRLQVFFDQKRDIIQKEPTIDYIQLDYWTLGPSNPEIKALLDATGEAWRREIGEAVRAYAPSVSEADCGRLSHVTVSMLMGASIQYLNRPGSMDLDQYFKLCMEMLLAQVAQLESGGTAQQPA